MTMDHLTDLETALQHFRYPIVAEDLNMDLDEARVSRIQRVLDLLVEYSILDLV